MKTAITYLIMGGLFTFLAINRIDESIWEIVPIILLLMAALDFLLSFQFMKKAMQRRKKKQ